MTVLTEADMIDAIITTEIGKIPYADITFNYGTTIATNDTVSITGTRKGIGSTVLFTGNVEDVNFVSEVDGTSISGTEELLNIRPSGTYLNMTQLDLLIEIIDEYCNIVTLPDAGACIGKYYNYLGWNSQLDGETPTGIAGANPVIETDDIYGHKNTMKMSVAAGGSGTSQGDYVGGFGETNGSIEFWFLIDEISMGSGEFNFDINYNGGGLFCRIYVKINGGVCTSYIIDTSLTTYTLINSVEENTWYHFRIDFEFGTDAYKGLDQDKLNIYINGIQKVDNITPQGSPNPPTPASVLSEIFYLADDTVNAINIYIDGFSHTWDTSYFLGKNLNYEQSFFKYPESTIEYPAQDFYLDGEKTIKQLLDEYADFVLGGWFLTHELDIYCNDLDTASSYTLNASTSQSGVDGKQQMKDIDYVELLGGWKSDGTRLRVTSGTGYKIFKDTYATITDENILQEIADQIIVKGGINQLKVTLTIYESTWGQLQVGETIAITESTVIFDDSDVYVPAGNYIIWKSRYSILTHEQNLTIYSGITFNKERTLPEENSELIRQTQSNLTNTKTDLETHDALTITAHGLAALLAIGNANARYSPCMFLGSLVAARESLLNGKIRQITGGNYFDFGFPKDPLLGSFKLYITHLKIKVLAADANDYIDSVTVYDDAGNSLYTEGTNRTSANTYEYTFPEAIDVSNYTDVFVELLGAYNADNQLTIGSVSLKYYYDT